MTSGGATARVTVTATVRATTGTVTLDKTVYPVNGKVTVTIVDPDMNTDSASAQQIPATNLWITTTTWTSPIGFTATETGPDTGTFTGSITLNSPQPGAPATWAKVGDGITVTYTDMATADGRTNVAITATATIQQYTGKVSFDKAAYLMTDAATISLEDPDRNTQPAVTEAVQVTVYSTSDPAGVTVSLIETGANTGIFKGTLTFTTGSSQGSTLRASDGDTVTVKYLDPNPSLTDMPTWQAGQTYTVTASARIGAPAPALPITAGKPSLLDAAGKPIEKGKVGTQLLLSTEMKNEARTDQSMLYIVQVKDAAGTVVYLSFVQGTVPGGKAYTFGIAWTPAKAGTYTVEVYAWESWTVPTPLSAVSTATVTVV